MSPCADARRPGTLHSMVVPGSAISQLRRGVLEFCVLALLRDGERYGFDLVRALADAGGLDTTEGTLYPLLARLRRDGVVETTWRESTAGPRRRYYRLTPAGHDALDAFTSEWTRFRTSVDAMLEPGAVA
jgi:PadR family transcriptional regulator PadR